MIRTFKTICLIAFVHASGARELHALPPNDSWRAGGDSAHKLSPDFDRIFIVNCGWADGKVLSLDEDSVHFREGEENHVIPRERVSLIELSDWLSVEKRLAAGASGEVALSVECEGKADRGALVFCGGAIVTKVTSRIVSGSDENDVTASDRASVSFDKQYQDFSLNRTRFNFQVLPGNSEKLLLEVDNSRLNVSAGEIAYTFRDAERSDSIIATFKDTLQRPWYRVELDLAKLSEPTRAIRLDPESDEDLFDQKVDMVEPPRPSSSLSERSMDRIFSYEDQVVTGAVMEISGEKITVQLPGSKSLSIPRNRVATIELNGWEKEFRDREKRAEDSLVTDPMRFILYGTAPHGSLNLESGNQILYLIRPPHFIAGRDINDSVRVSSEQNFRFDAGFSDRSPKQVEAVFQLGLAEGEDFAAGVFNDNGGGVGGSLYIHISNALDGKKIWSSSKSDSHRHEWTFDVSSSRLR